MAKAQIKIVAILLGQKVWIFFFCQLSVIVPDIFVFIGLLCCYGCKFALAFSLGDGVICSFSYLSQICAHDPVRDLVSWLPCWLPPPAPGEAHFSAPSQKSWTSLSSDDVRSWPCLAYTSSNHSTPISFLRETQPPLTFLAWYVYEISMRFTLRVCSHKCI